MGLVGSDQNPTVFTNYVSSKMRFLLMSKPLKQTFRTNSWTQKNAGYPIKYIHN